MNLPTYCSFGNYSLSKRWLRYRSAWPPLQDHNLPRHLPCRERWGTWDTEWLTPAARGQEQFVDRLQLYFVVSYLKTKQTLSQQRRRSFFFFFSLFDFFWTKHPLFQEYLVLYLWWIQIDAKGEWNKGKLILQTLDHMAFDKRHFWLNQMVRKGNMKLARHRSCCWPELCISNWKPKLFLFTL